MIEGKYLSGQEDLSEVYELRREVLQQELGLEEELDLDGQDEWAVHAVACQGETAVAVGRILFDGEHYSISHVAVRRELRRQGYGDFVVRLLINRAMLAGAQELYAQVLLPGMPEAAGNDLRSGASETAENDLRSGASEAAENDLRSGAPEAAETVSGTDGEEQAWRILLEKIGFVSCGSPWESGGRYRLSMCLKKESLHKCCNYSCD